MVLVCCCPERPQSQLDVEESTVTVQGTGQVLEIRGIAAYECQNCHSTTAPVSTEPPSKSFFMATGIFASTLIHASPILVEFTMP